MFKYVCNSVNFQKCLTNSAKIIIPILQIITTMWYTKSFNPISKYFFIIFSRYTVPTLENNRTRDFRVWCFLQARCFLSLGNRKKSQGTISNELWGWGSSTTFSCLRYYRSCGWFDEALSCKKPDTTETSCFNLWRTLPL
jgi:hypothetical protein